MQLKFETRRIQGGLLMAPPVSEVALAIGRRINTLRGSLSQEVFARQLGIPKSTLSRFERGRNMPDAGVLLAISRVCRVSIDWLVTGESSQAIPGPTHLRAIVPFLGDATPAEATAIPIGDVPKEAMKAWLDAWWATASQPHRDWLQIEFERQFPEFTEWKKKTGMPCSGQCGA